MFLVFSTTVPTPPPAPTAGAGPLWFVGLAVPHLARLICGPDYRWILPYSMLMAPILLLTILLAVWWVGAGMWLADAMGRSRG